MCVIRIVLVVYVYVVSRVMCMEVNSSFAVCECDDRMLVAVAVVAGGVCV